MRHFLLCLCLLLPFLSFAQEEIKYEEFSYAEFFQMIEDEEDSIFRLSNALIKPDPDTDEYFTRFEKDINRSDTRTFKSPQDSIYVNKQLSLSNVQFIPYLPSWGPSDVTGLHHISFQKKVDLMNVPSLFFESCTFHEQVNILFDNNIRNIIENLPNELDADISITNSDFKNGIVHEKRFFSNEDLINSLPMAFWLINSTIKTGNGKASLGITNLAFFQVNQNVFLGKMVRMSLSETSISSISRNTFDTEYLLLQSSEDKEIGFSFSNNITSGYVGLDLEPSAATNIKWPVLNGLSVGGNINAQLSNLFRADSTKNEDADRWDKKYLDEYFNHTRFENEDSYKTEQKIKGRFINLYRAQNDIDYANLVYVESKDLQTKRLAYLYQQNPKFKTFFKWRVNQFLKVFSAYGTEPERAIIFSAYVILAFALVYLFFPNHWDSHGKNRIVDRFSFFLKYMKRDAGMHDVYLEERKGDILAYDEYKQLLESSGKDVPKFFQATGLPLYKWAISGTKLTAGFLSRVDVMKGTWSELPQSKRVWKSVLLISAFLIALAYDIFIKMLNALMLSINTFTTLGFGEIPIKGLPRYLAIIQGFIGWFMLTIFSVSLISQLLN